jgi:hypothetical protein
MLTRLLGALLPRTVEGMIVGKAQAAAVALVALRNWRRVVGLDSFMRVICRL